VTKAFEERLSEERTRLQGAPLIRPSPKTGRRRSNKCFKVASFIRPNRGAAGIDLWWRLRPRLPYTPVPSGTSSQPGPPFRASKLPPSLPMIPIEGSYTGATSGPGCDFGFPPWARPGSLDRTKSAGQRARGRWAGTGGVPRQAMQALRAVWGVGGFCWSAGTLAERRGGLSVTPVSRR